MAINDNFKMVNASSLSHTTFVLNKSRIPIKVYQLNKAHKLAANFKSNSTFSVTKIPKLAKMSDRHDTSTLSTNTFNLSDKVLKSRFHQQNYKRTTSFNTDSNVSSLSDKSQLTESTQSVQSVASSDRNGHDLIKYIKKKLKEMEKRPSLDEMCELLAEETRTMMHKKINLHTLDALRLKYSSSKCAQNSSQSVKTKTKPTDSNKNVLELYFSNLKQIEQLFKSAQKELFDKTLAMSPTLSPNNNTNYQTNKLHKKLADSIEKFNCLIKDKDTGNIGLLSPESYTFSKQDMYKNGEFVLRLVADLVFKFRQCIKIYTRLQSCTASKDKLPSILKKDSTILNKASIIQNSIENVNESFIKETDCSSIVSDDDEVVSSSAKPVSPPESDNYTKLRRKIMFLNEDLNDLNMYLDSLHCRADRCAKLEERLKCEKEMIKKTETSLKMCDQVEIKRHMEKQLDYLRYKFKINLQDYNIEKICAPEIHTAISDTEFKIFKLSSYLKELNMSLLFTESKMGMIKKSEIIKNQHKQQQPLPRHLPPLNHFKEVALKQYN